MVPTLADVQVSIERHHWINTVVGVIDAAWHLTDEEQFDVIRIVSTVVRQLNIPERGEPAELPVPLVLEVGAGFYANQITSTLDSGIARPIRALHTGDQTVPVEIWAQSIVSLFTTAYPDLDGVERMYLTKSFVDLLAAIGVAERAPVFLPADVVRIYENP